MENAPDIKSKSFEKVLKYRLVYFDEICHFHSTQSAINTPIHTIKYQNLFHLKLNSFLTLEEKKCILNNWIPGYLDYLFVANFRN